MVLKRVVQDKIVDLTLVLDSTIERVFESLRPVMRILHLLLLLLVGLHVVRAHPLVVWASNEILGRIPLRVVLVKPHHLVLLMLFQVLRVDWRGIRG